MIKFRSIQDKFLILMLIISSVNCNILKTSNYSKLPKLYQYDDFQGCNSDPDLDGFYCITRSYIQPNESSMTWRDIKFISDDNPFFRLRHFRHEIIFAGLCLSRCKFELEKVDPTIINQLFVNGPILVTNFHQQGIPVHGELTLVQRKKFHYIVNQCFNHRLLKSHLDLKAYSEIEFCIERSPRPLDTLDILFLVLVTLVIIFVTYSTVTDLGDDELKRQKIINCFSIKRNWRIFYGSNSNLTKGNLKNDSKDEEPKERFIFLDAIRLPLSCFNIIGHSVVMLAVLPSTNPEFYEVSRYEFIMKLGANVPLTVLLFYGISAFLLTLNDMNTLEKEHIFKLKDFFQSLKKRLCRLIPVYMFVLLFEASIAKKFGTGPGWEGLAGRQWAYCRNNWWTNLFFINNFINVDQQCILPSKFLFFLACTFFVLFCLLQVKLFIFEFVL